ncbi:hypothetical protein V8G54_016245 [Vigna mungo]|uniref:Uncharacterized protein n=1 Tax=Vigna mungo TaxID=3915 RepID=A0AAQ3NJX0_VIGMU
MRRREPVHVLTLFDRVTEERDSDRRRRAGDLSSWTTRFLSGRSLPQKMMSSAGHMSELLLLLKPLKISPALSCNDEGRSIFLSDFSSKLGVLELGLSGRSQSESASSCSSSSSCSGDSMYSASFIMCVCFSSVAETNYGNNVWGFEGCGKMGFYLFWERS